MGAIDVKPETRGVIAARDRVALRTIVDLSIVSILVVATVGRVAWAGEKNASAEDGRRTYQYYCYQCHGYAGDARTLASTYLNPRPRDFTRTPPAALTRETMRNAISAGRPGTAMVSFQSVLTPSQIESVIDYIRTRFMIARPTVERYHTPANGWAQHDRYAAAFPFATGDIPLDRSWESLSAEQRRGKRLFLASCISCHDRARVTDEGAAWESLAVSYPRRADFQLPESLTGSPKRPLDAVSAASPYAHHETAPSEIGLTTTEASGRKIFLANCAFCHAPDGTGRHWIGSFLFPRPRNLNDAGIRERDSAALARTIADGLPGTSMPAWKDVLAHNEIRDVVSYIKRGKQAGSHRPAANREGKPVHASAPAWKRVDAGSLPETGDR